MVVERGEGEGRSTQPEMAVLSIVLLLNLLLMKFLMLERLRERGSE